VSNIDTGIETGLLSESNRDRLLRAVSEVCAERGYTGMTVAQVVERAGLSETDFDEIFSDLEECLEAAVNMVLAKALGEVSSSYAPDRNEWENGLHGLLGVLEMMAAHPSYAYLVYIAARQMTPPRIYKTYETGIGVFSSLVGRLWEYSELESQPQTAARAAVGSAEAVIRNAICQGRTEELPTVLPEFVYGLTVPFLGQTEALKLAAQARELLAGTRWSVERQ
jgi:AcrR family transcriptional regulator